MKILLDESRGVYIPQAFYENFDLKEWGVDPEEYKELANPNNENYWEAWDDLLTNARHVDKNNKTWVLYQDGDLFAREEGEDNEEV